MAKADKKQRKKKTKKSKSDIATRPIKDKMTKRQMIEHIASIVDGESPPSRATRLQTAKMMEALADTMMCSIMPGSIGSFMISKVLKVTIKTRPAIKKGTMVRSPATGGMVASKGRPESQSVRIRALAGLKKAAAGTK